MPAHAQSIQIFLPDGDPRSLRIAEITSRTVQVLAAPRAQLEALLKRKEIQGAVLYVLVGPDPEGALPLTYIGETEELVARARSHHKKKDWWDTILVVSRVGHFTKAHATWMEWHALQEAKAAGRCALNNDAVPTKPYVSEPMEADLLQFFERAKILFGVLGQSVFEKPTVANPGAQVRLTRRGASAVGEYGSEGFVVRAGSVAASEMTKSTSPGVAKKREALIKSGVLVKAKDGVRFAKDFVFATPSGAADVVAGASCNGWVEWKYPDGRTLHDVHRAK